MSLLPYYHVDMKSWSL